MVRKADIVFLIGMPGVGKTYWGKAIAQQYAIDHIDLDAFIETQAGQSIAAIISQEGEERFREIEHQTLLQLVSTIDRKTVISLGGGTPCYYQTMTWLNEVGTTIYLRASLPTLLHHLSLSPSEQRPLLSVPNKAMLQTKLSQLLNQRKAYYEQAHYIFDIEKLHLCNFQQLL